MTTAAVPVATPPVVTGFSEAVAAFVAAVAPTPAAEVTVQSLRDGAGPAFAWYSSLVEDRPDVAVRGYVVDDGDGPPLEVRWYQPLRSEPRGRRSGAAVYVHAGGMVAGDLDGHHRLVARYAGESGTPLLAVAYRLAPEHPAPRGAEDVLRALDWLLAHADDLGVDPARVGLMGDCGGGGVAAAAAIVARDRGGPRIARLVLASPMLDDRTTVPHPSLVPVATWSYEQNAVAWAAVTAGREPGPDGHVAPARCTDLRGLPPVHLDTGDCDIFRDEVLDLAGALVRAGVWTDVRLYRGVPHAFEVIAPSLPTSQRALEDRYAALRRI